MPLMAYPTSPVPATKKSTYQRPYKSRRQRRGADQHKYDEASDRKFLLRAAVAAGLVLTVALSFVLKGMMDSDANSAQTEVVMLP